MGLGVLSPAPLLAHLGTELLGSKTCMPLTDEEVTDYNGNLISRAFQFCSIFNQKRV